MKTKIHHSRKYNLDEYFFDKWSATMAYVLGFWFADGYMRVEKSYRIVLVSNDFQIIEDIRSALKSNHPITKSKRDNAFSISFQSKYLYQKLEKLGGERAKSKTMIFPFIPERYIRDFIRGYFDGDGSVFFVKYIRTKDKRLTSELRTNFTSGNKKFLEILMLKLTDKIGVSIKKLGIFNNGASLKLGYGMRDSEKLLRYMYYKDFPIGLKRKADFLNRIPKYQLHKYKLDSTLHFDI